jgi:hypothetical protein
MGLTRVFLPQSALNVWLQSGKAELAEGRFKTHPDGHTYRVVESLRVIQEVAGGADSYQLAGKVKPIEHVRELGAELLGDSMVLDDNAYDIVLGWVAVADSGNALHAREALDNAAHGPQADAEALAQFLARNL